MPEYYDEGEISANDLEDDGYYHDRDESEYSGGGDRIDYSVWLNDDGDEVWLREGVERQGDALGFDSDDDYEANML